MAFKNTPRRGSDRARPVMFTYLKELKGGTKFTGYIAGATWWGLVHPSERTQPCFTELTDGELTCPHCLRGAVPAIKGVCPLYVEPSRKAFFVWVDEELRDVVDGFKLHTRVIIGRDVGKGMPAWLTLATNQEPAFTSTLPERQRPADITPTLLKIFRSPELADWYYRTHGASDNAVSQVPVVKVVTKSTNDQAIANQEQYGDEKQQRERRNRVFIEAARTGSANGNGKPHKPNG